MQNKYGKLSVIEEGRFLWECQCECGKKAHVAGENLKSGKTKHCGCEGPQEKEPLLTVVPREETEWEKEIREEVEKDQRK